MKNTYSPLPVALKPLEGIDDDHAAAAFKALGDPTRLRIFQFLRSCTCCPVALGDDGEVRPVDGPTVGEVCCHVTGIERVTSTISVHLKELRAAGLIVTEKRGRHVVCFVPPTVPAALAAFFSTAPIEAFVESGAANSGGRHDGDVSSNSNAPACRCGCGCD